MVDDGNNRDEQPPSDGNDPTVELKSILDERNNRESFMKQAKDRILISGSSAFAEAEVQKVYEQDPDTGLTELEYHTDSGTVTLIGTQHRYIEDDPEIQHLGDLVRAIPEGSNVCLILEGLHGTEGELPTDPAGALKVGGEFGYMAALARQQGIEVIPAEPATQETARQILAERPDITRGELALHYALKMMDGLFN